MRKSISLLLPVLILCSFTVLKNKETVLSGCHPNLANSEVVFNDGSSKKAVKIDSLGCFSLILDINKEGLYNLKFARKPIKVFLSPGDQVEIIKSESGLKFKGAHSETNNYLLNWNSFYKGVKNIGYSDYYSMNPRQFLDFTEDLLDRLLKNFQRLKEVAAPLNADFEYMEERRLKYLVYADRNSYSGFLNNEIPDNFKNEFYSYLNDIELNDTKLIDVKEYVSFLQTYIELKREQKLKEYTGKSYDRTYATKVLFDIIEDNFTDQRFIDKVLFRKFDLSVMQFKVNDELMNYFSNNLGVSEKAINSFRAFYEKTKRLFPGNDAPNFELSDENGKAYKLDDFKGKYLLIDVWEISCSPCIRELPYLEEIEKEFNKQDFVIVSVSLDKSKDQWMKRKDELNVPGIQLIAKNGWRSEFAKNYLISMTPRYILIDKEGKIKYPDMPFPSKDMKAILSELTEL